MASYCTEEDINKIKGSFSTNVEEHRTIRFLPVLVIHKILLGGGKRAKTSLIPSTCFFKYETSSAFYASLGFPT